MRLLILCLTCFLALCGCHISSNKDFAVSAPAARDTGKPILIQNSGPKGGPYTDPSGKKFGYAIFWTRVSNETTTPVEFTIHFPADSFSIAPAPPAYFKFFLLPDTMTIDKEASFDYGITGLKSFMDTGLHQPTSLKHTIRPNKAYLFYVGMLMKMPDNGAVRTGLVQKDSSLFYRVSIGGQLDSALIPCGHINVKK